MSSARWRVRLLEPGWDGAEIARRRQASEALRPGRRAHDGFGEDVGRERPDYAGVRLAGPAARGEREDRVTVPDRMGRADRARQAVVGHQRHATDVGLRQPRIGCYN